MPDELPIGYYHTNFCKLLAFVQNRYHDLLTHAERACIDDFHDLTPDAQRLFVRLLTRKGPLYRSDRLAYEEIGETEKALDELSSAGFVFALSRNDGEHEWHRIGVSNAEFPEAADEESKGNNGLDTEAVEVSQASAVDVSDVSVEGASKDAVLALLTRHELIALLKTGSTSRRSQLVAEATQLPVAAIVQHLPFRVVMTRRLQEVTCFRLLFFGNTHQNLTEFVLRDLGVAPYETYTIDETSRFFTCRDHVEEVRRAYEISDHCHHLLETPDVTHIERFAGDFPEQISVRAMRLLDRTRNQMARQLERMQAEDAALAIYQQSQTHPARERQVRLLIAGDCLGDALLLVNRMLAEPWNEDELEFAYLSKHRILKKLGQPTTPPVRCQPIVNDLVLEAETDLRVEELVRRHYEQQGYQAHYVENALFPGLFGLLFWDVIFSHQPGVFFNEFQRGPVDMFDSRFVSSRQPLIDECFISLSSGNYRHRIRSTFRHKFPAVNYFVHWGMLDEVLLETCLDRIPADHLASVFRQMLRDLRNNRSGFPDLIVFPPGSGYELIEVKGPGDALQKHQRRWFGHFERENIPARVAKVEYAS